MPSGTTDAARVRAAGLFTIVLLGLAFVSSSYAQPAPGYYDAADTSSPTALRNSLHEIIDDHTRFPYTSTSTDTWDILEIGDEDQDNPGNVITIYRNASYPKQGGGNSFYNREHTWPKSYGFPNDGSTNYPYTDTHHLFIADSGYNSSRSNKPYNFCDASCLEKTTDANNGRGGVGGSYPGDSSWTSGSFTQGIWETWVGRRGDVARAMFYMDVRYEGGVHGITAVAEPDLILTDNLTLIDQSNTGSNESVAYMGMLSVLLQWHAEDPVDLIEFQHSEAAAIFQNNRNPFVDHPEWVECVFGSTCGGGDVIPPAPPTGLAATPSGGAIDLDWADNSEPDLAGYNVYRAEVSGGPYSQINTALVTVSGSQDNGVTAGITYYYIVTAQDASSNESASSAETSAIASGGTPISSVWVNEFHYDNKGGDKNEAVEVAGTAGIDLSGWTLVAYNGNGGTAYQTMNLSGIIADQQGCIGTANFALTGLQNGAPDGIALVDHTGVVIDFLSYEGTFTATDGPAAGLVSVDTGVQETSSTKRGHSLQLGGTGASAADFIWQSPQGHTRGAVNASQTFDGCGADVTPPAAPSGLVTTALDAQVLLDWTANSEPDLAGYHAYRSTSSGGPYTRINGSLLTTNSYTDTSAVNGTTYFYVVTAVDGTGNESANSGESSATPQAPPSGGTAWINEFHYDNSSGDVGEFVEIAGSVGVDLAGWQIIGYNGNGGGTYSTVNLSGLIPDQANGHGTLAFDFTGLQNGSPDGIALVDSTGTVAEFLSYEGTIVATNGPASGMTSEDVGVTESSSTPIGYSLQRTGTGSAGSDFVWAGPGPDTYGTPNTGQSF